MARKKNVAPLSAALKKKLGDTLGKDGSVPAYAWPGGYPLYYVVDDGGRDGQAIVHPDAVNDARYLGEDDVVVDVEVNWEDANLVCEVTGKVIESAYGGDDDDDDDADEGEPWISKHEERDNLDIVLYRGRRDDPNESEVIAEWHDDEARQMFEDGFFSARRLEQSVIEYAEQHKLFD